MTLTVPGALTEGAGGAILTPLLAGSATSAALGGGNAVGTLGSFTIPGMGAFALTDTTGLAVSGPLTAASAALNVTGTLTLAGTVSAPGGVSLVASGAITQGAGAITTASLSGSAASASLGQAANVVGGVWAISPPRGRSGWPTPGRWPSTAR